VRGHTTQDINFSKVILGGNVFGWTVDLVQSLSLLDYAPEQRINTIDTADMYSTWVEGHVGGEYEAILGEWFKRTPSHREKITLITKVGAPLSEAQKGLPKNILNKQLKLRSND